MADAASLACQVPLEVGGRRMADELTSNGTDLRHIESALRDWGLKWEPGNQAARQIAAP